MNSFGHWLMLFGVLTIVLGLSGFIDVRKVDRRFKTGYKNNEPDRRNLRGAAKRVLYGIGMCLVSAVINNLTSRPEDKTTPTAAAVSDHSQPLPVRVP